MYNLSFIQSHFLMVKLGSYLEVSSYALTVMPNTGALQNNVLDSVFEGTNFPHCWK